jgi:hypothetical protein
VEAATGPTAEVEVEAAAGRGGGRGGMQRWKPSPDLLQRWRLRR